MKKILFASVIASLTACGESKQNSNTSTSWAPGANPGELQGDSYVFSVDRRFVDGNFEEISIVRSNDGRYEAKLKVITAGFGAPAQTTVDILGTDLTCSAYSDPMLGKAFLSLTCSVDKRYVDGALVELKLTRSDANGVYDATLHTVSGGMVGAPVDVTTEIATGLQLKTGLVP